MASEDLWILGIHMTNFGSTPIRTWSTWPPRPSSGRWPTLTSR